MRIHYLTAYEESKCPNNDPEAARYRKEAIEYFGKANRVTNQRYAVADLKQ